MHSLSEQEFALSLVLSITAMAVASARIRDAIDSHRISANCSKVTHLSLFHITMDLSLDHRRKPAARETANTHYQEIREDREEQMVEHACSSVSFIKQAKHSGTYSLPETHTGAEASLLFSAPTISNSCTRSDFC